MDIKESRTMGGGTQGGETRKKSLPGERLGNADAWEWKTCAEEDSGEIKGVLQEGGINTD